MADSTTLSTLDLASLLAGYLSLGCSLWSAFPQIYLLASFPPSGGPHPWMLVMWLLGDAAQLVGMYVHGALETQKLSAIWFAISDVIIMLEMAIGRGLLPGTSCWTRRKLTKTHQAVSVGEDQGVEVEDVGWGPTATASSSRPPKSGALARSRGLVRRHMPNLAGPRVNAAVLGILLVVAFACWGALDVSQRDSKQALEPGQAPRSTADWIGWGTALAGTVLYNFPRLVQIRKIRRDKGMENMSVWMFGWLLAQNYTMLISILTISHTLDALEGQAPFIFNTVLALALDHVIVYLWDKYRPEKRPGSPEHVLPHPTQAGLARTASLLAQDPARRSPSPRHLLHSSSMADQDRREDYAWLTQSYKDSLREERARARGHAWNLPLHLRRARARQLDTRAAVEDEKLTELKADVHSMDPSARDEYAEWVRQNAETRGALRELRNHRRESDARAEQELEDQLIEFKKAQRSRGMRPRSEVGDDSGFSTSLSESSGTEHPLAKAPSTKRSKHPRRGVGTESGNSG